MFLFKTRREREKIIINEMIRMFCAGNHNHENGFCEDCRLLASYAEKRILSCLYGEIKPVCKECPVHCYSPSKRAQMQQVMRYSGPRMIFRRPAFAFVHMIDKLSASKPRSKTKRKT